MGQTQVSSAVSFIILFPSHLNSQTRTSDGDLQLVINETYHLTNDDCEILEMEMPVKSTMRGFADPPVLLPTQ